MKIVFAIIFSLLVLISVKGIAQASVKVKNNTAYSVTVFVETSAGLNSEVLRQVWARPTPTLFLIIWNSVLHFLVLITLAILY
ncbi:MAG: hypothetical protein EOO04_28020 [Chitinophagaceae bacterium]|nr:MAG: hypothetical protein EOO04_28020 [Chitinophagaceae bacterium]